MRRLVCIAAILLLTACGGGRGTELPVTGPEETPPVTGPEETPPGSGPEETPPGSDAGGAPNTLVSSDIVVIPGNEPLIRLGASCAGPECSYIFGGNTDTVSLDDALSTPLSGTFTETGSRGGVATGTGSDSLGTAVGTIDLESYGGWLEHGGFAAAHGNTGDEIAVLLAVSTGYSTRTNPVSGSASWSGAMAGKTRGGSTVEGDAELTAEFSAADIDVEFSGIADIDDPASTYPDMTWYGLDMQDGTFSGPGIDGRFYGPDHEEAGGVFERDGIVGGFAAKRN